MGAEANLADSGFTREIGGCYDWCSSFLTLRLFDVDFMINAVSTPDAAGVQHLLDALNPCFRLGDETGTFGSFHERIASPG